MAAFSKISSVFLAAAFALLFNSAATAAAVNWTGLGDGVSWSDPANWSGGALPPVGSDVTISVPAADPTILFTSAAGVVQINSLTTNEVMTISGGTLDVATKIQASDNLTLDGGGATSIKSASIRTVGTGTFTAIGGTLDGVTLDQDLRIGNADGNANLYVKNGLTLNNASLILAGPLPFSGPIGGPGGGAVITFQGTQTLSGSGNVIFGLDDDTELRLNYFFISGTVDGGIGSATLTIGSNITVRGKQGVNIGSFFEDSLVNLGTLELEGKPQIYIQLGGLGDFINRGVIRVGNGVELGIYNDFSLEDLGTIETAVTGNITFVKGLIGNVRLLSSEGLHGTTTFGNSSFSSDVSAPLLIEVMSNDLGASISGTAKNFAFASMVMPASGYVKLIDQFHNAAPTGAEAVYAQMLTVPAGCTLDLNGLNLYARIAQVSGTVLNGSITLLPDSGPLALATPTPGSISVEGEVDEWTFSGRAGRSVSVSVNPGAAGVPAPLSPQLQWANVQFLDASNAVLATATNLVAGEPAVLTNFALPADGTYKIRINAPLGHSIATGNYIVSAYDVTPDVRTLTLGQQVTGDIATPFAVDQWKFSASAGQQIKFDLLSRTPASVVFKLEGPAGYVGFQDISTDSELINLPASGSYTLTAYGPIGQTGNYGFAMRLTSVTPMALGVARNGTWAGSGQAQIFSLPVATISPLLVALDDSDASHRAEVYARFGAPPTRQTYDYAAKGRGANHDLLIPSATAGTWYILVYGESIPNKAGNFTLLAQASEVVLTGTSTATISPGNNSTITLTGAGFNSGSIVSLVSSNGMVYPAAGSTTDLYNQMTATFAANTIPPGTYTIRITQSSGAVAELPAGLSVVAGQAVLATSVEVPSPMGQNVATTLYVHYANTGTVPMPAPLLVLTGTNHTGLDGAFLTLDGNLQTAGFWTSAQPSGYSPSVQILASGATPGVLAPGESFSVPVYYAGWLPSKWTGGPALDFALKVIRETDATPMDWLPLEASLKPPGMPAAAWSAMFSGLRTRLGTTSGEFVRLLNTQAGYLSGIGRNVSDVSKLWSFLIAQSANYWPVRTLGSAVDGSLPTPGNVSLSFDRSFNASIPGRFQSGPLGLGWYTSWQQSLEFAADGTVTRVAGGGARFTYQPDRRSTTRYFSATGDQDVFTAITGGYKLTALDGTTTIFKTTGTLDYVQDTNGNRITAAYTGSRLTSLTASSGQSLTLGYNAAGLISTLTDSAGRVTTYGYDASNERLISVTAHTGLVTTYGYNTTAGSAARNALTTITRPDGTHQYLSYDTQGRLAGTTADGGLQANTFTYAAGKVSITDATAKTSSLYFDQNGQMAKIVDAEGNPTYLGHDSKFNLTSVTNAVGAKAVMAYNKLGQMVSATDFLGNTTHVTYGGPQNQPRILSDAKGNQTRYDYSPTGNLLKTTFANNKFETTTFDPLGNALSFTNAAYEAIQYSHNAAGQVTSATFPDGSSFAYTYDSRGRLLTATDTGGTTTFTYHPVTGFMTGVAYPEGRALTFTYDTGGRRSSMVDHTGFAVKYGYDAVGRLSTLRDAGNSLIVTYTYDANGRLSQKTNANGTYSTYTYDANGRVLSLINRAPGGAINSRFDDTYNALGLKTSETTLEGAWTYSYDANGQLIRAVFASNNVASIPNQDLAYQYDALGNRTKTVINGVTTNYVADSMNQYISVGGTPYSYDSKGNLLSDGTNTFTYNVLNKLVGVSGTSGTTTYAYNALGQRVSTTAAGQTTKDLIDPAGLGNVVGTFGNGGSLIAQYVHGLGLASQVGAGGTSYYDSDVLGSIAGMSGAGGSYTNRYSYLPFGGSLQATSTVQNPFQFVGAAGVENEGNGILFMRARSFDPIHGRFLQIDPIRIEGGINLYGYVSNTPLILIDPLGLSPNWPEVGKGIVVGAVGVVGIVIAAPVLVSGATAGAVLGFIGGIWSAVAGITHTTAGLLGEEVPIPTGPGRALDWWRDRPTSPTGPLGPNPRYRERPLPPQDNDDNYSLPGSGPPPPLNGGDNGGTSSAALAQSRDPNAVYGPSGFGPSNFVTGFNNTFAYRVTYENDKDATAPAQSVTITNNLDSNLDWSTFQLTGIGFADNYLVIPPGNQHYQATVSMTYNGLTFDVEMEAGIHSATGQVYASFYSIDPNTSLPPANVLTGFLPPEDGTGRGEGYISYTVSPKSGLATGVVIPNIASIVFDANEAITTDQIDPHDPSKGIDPAKQARVSIDSNIPTGQVVSFPAVVKPDFLVSWGGNDGSGSGVGSYTVYVSTDGGSTWSIWLANTAATSATYNGVAGTSYRFYVIAKDNTGNSQLANPATASVGTTAIGSAMITLREGDIPVPAGTGTINFGSITMGGSVNRSITIRNNGPATLSNLSLSLTGTSAAKFQAAPLSVATLAPGGTNTFDVAFSATAPGAYGAVLRVSSNDPFLPDYDINLLGTVVAPQPEIEIDLSGGSALASGSGVSFGEVAVGTSSSLTFNVRNLGSVNLTGLTITQDGAQAAEFMVTTLPVSPVPAGGSTPLVVTFTPSAGGLRTGVIHLASNDADENPFNIVLSGTGLVPTIPVPPVVVVPPSVGVASVVIGDVPDQMVTAGAATAVLPFTVGPASATLDVRASSSNQTIAPDSGIVLGGSGANRTISVKSVANESGVAVITLTVSDGARTATDTFVLTVNPGKPQNFEVRFTPKGKAERDGYSTREFGSVKAKNKAGVIRKITVTNTGTKPLTRLAVVKDGSSATDFVIKGLNRKPLAPRKSITIDVVFRPRNAGNKKAFLHFFSSETMENPFDLTLSGTGR